jgi:hypothetical protein
MNTHPLSHGLINITQGVDDQLWQQLITNMIEYDREELFDGAIISNHMSVAQDPSRNRYIVMRTQKYTNKKMYTKPWIRYHHISVSPLAPHVRNGKIKRTFDNGDTDHIIIMTNTHVFTYASTMVKVNETGKLTKVRGCPLYGRLHYHFANKDSLNRPSRSIIVGGYNNNTHEGIMPPCTKMCAYMTEADYRNRVNEPIENELTEADIYTYPATIKTITEELEELRNLDNPDDKFPIFDSLLTRSAQ